MGVKNNPTGLTITAYLPEDVKIMLREMVAEDERNISNFINFLIKKEYGRRKELAQLISTREEMNEREQVLRTTG